MSTGSSQSAAPSTGTPRSLDIILRGLEKRSGETFNCDYAKNSQNNSYATSLDDIDSNTEGKPELPYTVGATFVAHRHEPPAPFGHGYDTLWPPFKTGDFRLPQIDYCLARQPIEGRTLAISRELTITEFIRTGYSYGAQVVVVNGNVVAKIYDPLYDAGSDCYDNKRDVVVLADGDYSREATAYEELEWCLWSRDHTPRYYGSWTIEVHTTFRSLTYIRHVRLILIEHIIGTVMSSIQAQLLSRQTRSAIMEKVLKAESLIFNTGIWHRDMSPRNVMLVSPSSPPSFDDPNLRVVIIDFNVSNIIRLTPNSCRGNESLLDPYMRDRWRNKTVSPVIRFWDAMQEFKVRGWVNDEYGKANEWLWEYFGSSEDYVQLVRGWDDKEVCPRIAWRSGLDVEEEEEDNRDGAVEATMEISVPGGGEDDEVVFQGWGCKVSVSS